MAFEKTTEVVIVGRKKGSDLPWKPMPQIKVLDFNDAVTQLMHRSDVIDQGLDLGIKVTEIYVNIPKL